MTRQVSLTRVAAVIATLGVLLLGCSPSPSPTPSLPPVAFGPISLTGVGAVPAGRTSISDMTIQLTEASAAAIPRGAGTLVVTFTDAAGAASISLTGAPEVVAPGSLGVSTTFAADNVLVVAFEDSDTTNVEQVTISGVRLAIGLDAAPGAIRATITECSGALTGCVASRELPSPGTVGAS